MMPKKRIRTILVLLICFISLADGYGEVTPDYRVFVSAEALGAKGDGVHDDTKAIQNAIDSLDMCGGGTLFLGRGTFLVSSLKLGIKTSLIGCGNGATIIKQKKGVRNDCLIVSTNSAALKIADLTIVGNSVNKGIYIENSKTNHENHKYLYSLLTPREQAQPYKWLTIDNVCVYFFDIGLQIEPHGFDINICNSTISHNGSGVIMKCTDSSMYNCYVTNNKKDGVVLLGYNLKISNVKSIFNGIANANQYGAVVVKGSRCQINNCETQDNYGSGFVVEGQYNLFSNCMSNTDGYVKEPKGYDSSAKACGFKIKGLYNSFANCAVTNYNEKYGAVYCSPVMVDQSVSYYYPGIFNDIKVLIAKDKLLFNEPYCNVQTLSNKNAVQSVQHEKINNSSYFVSTLEKNNIIKGVNCGLGSLNVLLDFQCKENRGELVSIKDINTLVISLVNRSLCLLWNGQKKTELAFDENTVLNQDDIRLILSISQYGQKVTVSMLCYEKTRSRGWIKKEVRQDVNIPALYMKNADVRIGDAGVAVKRLAVTNSPLPESVFLPYSNTNRIYDGSIVYVDADSAM